MRILVTGAAGFIGQHLVKHLAEDLGNDMRPTSGEPWRPGHEVVVTDKVPLDDCAGHATAGFGWDIREHAAIPGLVEEARGCEAVVHLAAVAAPRIAAADPAAAWDTNARGTANVLTLAKKAGIARVLFFSSAHVYGISPKYMPTDEAAPLVMHDTYTITKIIGEDLCRRFFDDGHLAPTVFRLFNCYGPGQNPDYFLGAKLAQAAALARAKDGRVLEVRGSEITKDWIHVIDVVRAARLAIESKHAGVLNVGTGLETNLGDLGKQIAKGFGIGIAYTSTDDPGPTRMRADITRIESVLGWRPQVKVRKGLADLIEHAKKDAGL